MNVRCLKNNAIVLVLVGLIAALLLSKVSTAGLPWRLVKSYQVVIDGVDYGVFDRVRGFQNFGNTVGHYRVTLERTFVVNPSLSWWARQQLVRRQVLRDIALRVVDDDGVARQIVLRHCQPLSWSVAATVPSFLGGYHETIDLAVQEVSYL